MAEVRAEPGDEAVDGAPGFEAEFEGHRGALLAHCYRMLGSYHDAEDLVQETYLRARRGYADFEGRSSVRTWLYRIATNACLTALDHRSRRVLPSGLGAPSDDPLAWTPDDLTTPWLEPLPDAALARAGVGDPLHAVVERETVRLALVAALQHLAPRQRAALLLREVLAWSAEDIGALMGIGVPAVKSLLQRARARLAEVRPDAEDVAAPAAGVERALLDRWIRAFETADVRAIEQLVRDDFSLEATTHPTWFRGKAVCLPFLERQLGPAGRWRLLPTRANGQPAAATYLPDGVGGHRARGLGVLTVAGDRLVGLTNFLGAEWVAAAGLPAVLPGDGRATAAASPTRS